MTRALVLAGGGVAGIAWELGLLEGLARNGVDVTDADLVIGTSAVRPGSSSTTRSSNRRCTSAMPG